MGIKHYENGKITVFIRPTFTGGKEFIHQYKRPCNDYNIPPTHLEFHSGIGGWGGYALEYACQ